MGQLTVALSQARFCLPELLHEAFLHMAQVCLHSGLLFHERDQSGLDGGNILVLMRSLIALRDRYRDDGRRKFAAEHRDHLLGIGSRGVKGLYASKDLSRLGMKVPRRSPPCCGQKVGQRCLPAPGRTVRDI